MTKPIKLILGLCLLALFYIFGPSIWNKIVTTISNQNDVSKVIFLGSPIACETFKNKMVQGTDQFKKSVFDQIINVLSISEIEYKNRSQSQNSNDTSSGSIPDDVYLADGGQFFGQRCLFDLLVFYPTELEKTITLLFKSPFLASKANLQNQFAFQGFIEKQCQNNLACLKPLKDQMGIQDVDFVQKYGPLLAQLGEAGGSALFDVFQSLSDTSLGDVTQETPLRKKADALLTAIAYAPIAALDTLKIQIKKHLNDPQFSKIKKQLITANYQLKVNYQSAGNDPVVQQMLDRGKQIKLNFQTQPPAGTEDLTNWLISIDRFNGEDLSDQEKTELTSLLEFFTKWICDNLGLNSLLVKHIILTATFTDKIKLPMKVAQDLLAQPKFAPVGLKLLLLENPMSPQSENSLYKSFSQLSFHDKEDVFRFANEPVNKKSAQPIQVIFNLGLNMNYNEYIGIMPLYGTKKDDILLVWKKYSTQIKRGMNENELILYYEVSKDLDLLKSLEKIWDKDVICTQNRLENLTGIARTPESLKIIEHAVLNHLTCADDKTLKKDILNLVKLLRSSDNRISYTTTIEKNTKLSPDLKSEFLKIMNSESIEDNSDL